MTSMILAPEIKPENPKSPSVSPRRAALIAGIDAVLTDHDLC